MTIRFTSVLLSIGISFAAPAALSQDLDQDFINRAYETCVMHMSHHITPTGDGPLAFDPVEDVIMADEYEVLISFPAGAIQGAVYDEPNALTGMTTPAGSCIAYPQTSMIVRVVVDGEIVNKHEIAVN